MLNEMRKFRFRPSDYVGKKIDVSKLNSCNYRFFPVGDHMLPAIKIIVAEGTNRNYDRPSRDVLSISFADDFRIYNIERLTYVVFPEERWWGGWYDEFSEATELKSAEILKGITFGGKRSMLSYSLSADKCQQLLTDMFVKYPTMVSADLDNNCSTVEDGHWHITHRNPDYHPDLITDVYYKNDSRLIIRIDCCIKAAELKGKVRIDELIKIASRIFSCSKPIIPDGGKTDQLAHHFSQLYYQDRVFE